MAGVDGSAEDACLERWEQEVLARHRWGQHGDRAGDEHAQLRRLWDAAQPLDESDLTIVDQIAALEICNWNLEENFLALCAAIGSKRPVDHGTGHLASVSDGRWRRLWAYYAALRDWLPSLGNGGHGALGHAFDPDAGVRNHVFGLLGDRDELKELYVERLCLCIQFWFHGFPLNGSATMTGHAAAVAAVEEAIRTHDPDTRILDAMRGEGDGTLEPCHHKAFRRYDIIISSIGAGTWRGAMPVRGTDGLERAAVLDNYLSAAEVWVEERCAEGKAYQTPLSDKILDLLGERDAVKVFQASLLASLLRSQQLAARTRAEKRLRESS